MKRLAAFTVAMAAAAATAFGQDSISARLGQLRPNDIVITNVDGFVSTTTITGAVERAVGDALGDCVKYDDLTRLGLTNNLGSAAFETPSEILAGETDPVFRNWSETNRYVKAEADPVFDAWSKTNNLASKDYVDSHMPSGFLPVKEEPYGTNTAFVVTNLLQVGENELLVSSPTGVVTLSAYAKGASTGSVTGVKGGAETSYRIGNVDITKANIGLGNVNNTSDMDKPISTATAKELNLRVYTEEPYILEWFDGTTHVAYGEPAYNLGVHTIWVIDSAFNLNNWRIYYTTNTWIAVVAGQVATATKSYDDDFLFFTIYGNEYQFKYRTKSVLTTVLSQNNPHNVTGQQIGVLNPSGKIFTNLVVTSSILNGAVTGAKITENTVQASKIMNKTLIPSKFNPSASVDWTPVSGLIGRAGLYIYGDDNVWYKIGVNANHELYVTTVDTPPTAYYEDVPDATEANDEP